MKKLLYLFFSLLLIVDTQAQQQDYHASVYFMPTVQFFRFNEMNTMLEQFGFPQTGPIYANGVGGFGKIKNWRIGGEGFYFNSSPENKASAQTNMNGGLGYFYGAYTLSIGQWQLIPTIGIGMGGVRVITTKKTDTSLGNLITNQPNSSVISNGNGLIHIGLSLEKIVNGNINLGCKSGYNLNLSKNYWDAPGLTSSVKDPFGGFQLSLLVGFLIK